MERHVTLSKKNVFHARTMEIQRCITLKRIGDWKQNFRRHLSPEVAWNPLGTSFRGGAARRRDRRQSFENIVC